MNLKFKINKIGLGLSATMAVLSLFVSPFAVPAMAQDMPILGTRYLVTNLNRDGGQWKKSTTAQPGDVLEFDVELHNTTVGTDAINPRVNVTTTMGEFTNGTSTNHYKADNASEVGDQVQLTMTQPSSLGYMQGTTVLFYDQNGDGNMEFNNTPVADGIAQGGFALPGGVQHGCNSYIARLTFEMRVSGTPTATPTPTPSPTVTPTPTPTPVVTATPTPTPGTGGNTTIINNNENKNKNENNINITNTNGGTPVVTTASVPTKTPETGPDVLGLATMFGAAPLGVVMSRYGRGRLTIKKKDEDLNSIANDLVKTRNGQA